MESSIESEYGAYHKKGQELLGGLYNEVMFDQIMEKFLNDQGSFRKELDALEIMVSSAVEEKEKDRVRKEWMAKYNVLAEVLDTDEGEE